MADIPVVETPRLRLRAHTPDDFAACTAMWADPAVTRYTGGRAFTAEETWARLLRYAGHWAWFGHGFWAVDDANGFVGELGFADFRRAIDPAITVPEIGWAFTPHAHGKGYAREGVAAACRWADANLPARKTVCIIDPDNARSIGVARANGYTQVARLSYKGGPTLLFERGRNAAPLAPFAGEAG